MKIRINKIFGKYNNEIDFSKNLNIFIGENGIGKSTCIKILNCLLNFDYIGLLNYYFESIEIIEESEKILIKYDDIAISKEHMLMEYCDNDYEMYMKFKPDYNEISEKYNCHPVAISFDDNTNEEYKENWYKYAFYYDFDWFNEQIDNRLLYKILKNDDKILSNERIVTKSSDITDDFIYHIREVYNKEKKNIKKEKFYLHSNIAQKHIIIEKLLTSLKYPKVLMVNMANDFEIYNNFNRNFVENKVEVEVLDQKYKEIKNNRKNNKKINFGMLKYCAENIRNVSKKYPGLIDDSIIKKLKENYRVIRKEGIYENKIDIGYYLFNQIYTDEFINEFKNDFYDFLKENINNYSNELLEFQITSKDYNKIKLYLKPLLDKENIFYDNLNEEYIPKYIYGQEYELLFKFVEKYKDKYFNIQDEKLIKLNQLFEKYFTNKEIIATPFGISISTKDYGNDIYFEELSAGEQKIIILLTISVFSDDLIILLDEPETSLSVVWQKELLMDIVSNSKLKNLIVATQSPYIVSNNELLEYLVLLPMEDKNEQ